MTAQPPRWMPLVASLSIAAPALAQPPTITDLGAIGGAGTSAALAVSADGRIVVGESNGQAFVWTQATGMVALGGVSATGVSRSGEVICGLAGQGGASGEGLRSVRWTAWTPAAIQDLHTFGHGGYSVARGVSASGSVIVGNAYNGSTIAPDTVPYRWSSADGSIAMDGAGPTAGVGTPWGAQAASADGSVIVGNSGIGWVLGFRWTAQGGAKPLFYEYESSARAVSADGNVVVGYYRTGSQSGMTAFRWNAAAPTVYTTIADLPGGAASAVANGVSADGATVVGSGTTATGPAAFIWEPQSGTRNLRDVLIARGAAGAAGWTLSSATAISADGTTIVGLGTSPGGAQRAWSVNWSCYANCDGSSQSPSLNILDLTCFLQRFAAQDPYANCDGSTAPPLLSVADFTCFLQRFQAGCQ